MSRPSNFSVGAISRRASTAIRSTLEGPPPVRFVGFAILFLLCQAPLVQGQPTWVAPSFVVQPTNQNLTVDDNLLLVALATGVPEPSYQWLFNGQPLPIQTFSTLTLFSVGLNDAGNYSIVASNVVGSVTSAVASVTITGQPPVVFSKPSSQTVFAGDNATLSVSATAHPAPAYQWQFGGKDVVGATNPTLYLSNVSSNQAGDYLVIISNPFGSLTSSVATLSVVYEAPLIRVQPADRWGSWGDRVSFSVSAEAHPAPTYSWLFNGTNGAGNNASLSFYIGPETQSGEYRVVLANSVGSITSAPAHLVLSSVPGYYLPAIYSFGSEPTDGRFPKAALARGTDHVFYGTTASGGQHGAGTVFRLNPDGTGYGILHHFGTGSPEGNDPEGGVVDGGDGAIYGVTSHGGTNGTGTVFRLNKDGTGYTDLVSLRSTGVSNGPNAAPILGSDGALYGITAGGSTDFGAVFSIGRDGRNFTLLHDFNSGGMGFRDGAYPYGALMEGSDGAFYGTTLNGGSTGGGTVFRLSNDGSGYAILHGFGGAELSGPLCGLVEGLDGALYGTAAHGGSTTGGGIFRVSKDGTAYSIINEFGQFAGDGYSPTAPLMVGRDGALYGIVAYTPGYFAAGPTGFVYRVTIDGAQYNVLYKLIFSGNYREWTPQAGFVLGDDGAFYGTTTYGGAASLLGNVLRLWPPQTPNMIACRRRDKSVEVDFQGLGLYRYQVLRSTDLASWTFLITTNLPVSGFCTLQDNAAPGTSAQYRAAWEP